MILSSFFCVGKVGLQKVLTRDGEEINRKRLFVLMVAGKHLDNGLDIIPVHAARLLYDLGIQIMVVAFDDVGDQVTSIARNQRDVFEMHKGDSMLKFMNEICNKFEMSK